MELVRFLFGFCIERGITGDFFRGEDGELWLARGSEDGGEAHWKRFGGELEKF